MPLHLDYRPKTLDEVAGNVATVNNLKTMLNRKREDIPHAMLFSGPSGCGKTTLGRIVANSLGCSSHDFKEVDTADFRGIDTIREIRKQMVFKPIAGESRVWLLDEVHRLTGDGQSALLKALEDTPPWVYFILATTDPHKLLPTIQNRLLHYQVSLLPDNRLTKLLKDVVYKEKKQVPTEVFEKIVDLSKGSPRVALIALDKVIDMSQDRMKDALDENFLDEEQQVIELCRAMMRKEGWKKISSILNALKEDPEKIRRVILGYFSSVLLKADNPVAYLILDKMRNPFYDTGKPGLVVAIYEAVSDYK